MKIAIISDTHDRKEELRKLIKKFNGEIKPAVMIHCGDFCAPFMIKEMANFNGEVHCVFGNIDDKYTSTQFAIDTGVNLHGTYAELEKGGKKIGIVHFPALAEAMALSGKYDIVFYGHDHKATIEKRGKTLLINPGELAGLKEKPSYAIYDTDKNEIKLEELK